MAISKKHLKMIHEAGKRASAQCDKDFEKITMEGLGIRPATGPKDGLNKKECRRLRRILDEVEESGLYV